MNGAGQAASDSITRFRGDTASLPDVVNLLERMQPEYYGQEVERIFRRAWLPVLPLDEIPQPDGYCVVTVPVLKASLLLTRDGQGLVRAFHNICRHRANRLVAEGKGCARSFTCGFHAWTFASDGQLAAVTDASQFPGLDRAKWGLVPVTCETWEDLVFVNFSDQPEIRLRHWLGELYDGYHGYFAGREQIANWSIVVNANWHITVNAFTEGYHSLFLHRNTLPDYQGGKGNPMRHRPFLEVMERHGRYSAKANPAHAMPPVEACAYGHGRKLYPAFPPLDCSAPDFPRGINPGRIDDWAFDIVEFFPHFVLIQGADWHQMMWFWPIDVDHTEIRVLDYAYAAGSVGDRMAHSYLRVRNREVFREDISTMEAIHAMMRAGATPTIILSQQEMLIRKHYATAAAMMAVA